MKKIIFGLIITALIVGQGLVDYSLLHKTVSTTLGGVNDSTPYWFYNGFSAGNQSTTGYSGSNLVVDSNGVLTITTSTVSTLTSAIYKTATVGVSTTSPAAFSSAAAGILAVPAGTTTYNASTTAIGQNSQVFLTQISTTSNPSLLSALGAAICNTTNSTSSPSVQIWASSTAPTTNGFSVKLGTAPITQPQCWSWHVLNK